MFSAYTRVSLWPACMKGIDANSEVTFQGSHVITLFVVHIPIHQGHTDHN